MRACGCQEAAARRARDQARREAVRARRDAEKATTPALQRVMDAVPEGPLGLLRRCHLAREATRVRVVTRHRRGVRGVATGARGACACLAPRLLESLTTVCCSQMPISFHCKAIPFLQAAAAFPC